MQPDQWMLYREMLRSRLFEEAVCRLWEDGLISGEMHTGMGEEGIAAGVVTQLIDGDALALDHRGTPPLVMRGVDLVPLLREMLGRPDGLCGGQGGHMHLFSPQHLAASSGIVGAAGPAAAGFALAAQQLRPGAVAVAFFGEGAANQGMLLESFNLAAAWKLPVLFICKDNGWAITTPSPSVTAGSLGQRARGFGLDVAPVDGLDVEAVWQAARAALERARRGDGPTFIQATCVHLEGHFLGDQMFRVARHPIREMVPIIGPLTRAFLRPKGAPPGERLRILREVSTRSARLARSQTARHNDPLDRLRAKLEADAERLEDLEQEVQREILEAVEIATAPQPAGG